MTRRASVIGAGAALLVTSMAACLACAGAPADGRQAPATAPGGETAETLDPGPNLRDEARADVAFPGGRRFVAEIADRPARQAIGYMHRSRIGPDEAMVFVFAASGVRTFWMKNVLVPLDMIWMDESFRIVHIDHSVPPCRSDPCPSYGTVHATRYVLEVAGGIARAEGLAIGDQLEITFPEGRR